MPQHTHGPAQSSPTLQHHEQKMLIGACVFCEVVAVLCVVPPPGKSNGIQRKNHTPPLPCTQAQGPHSYGRSTPSSTVAGMGAATAQLPCTLGTVGAPRRAAHQCPPRCPLFPPRAHSFLDVSFACTVQVIHNFLQCLNSLSEFILLPLRDHSSGQCLQNRQGGRVKGTGDGGRRQGTLHSTHKPLGPCLAEPDTLPSPIF